MHPRQLTIIAFLLLFSLHSVNGFNIRPSHQQTFISDLSDPIIGLSVYPNPSSGLVSIEIKKIQKPITMNLFDIIGNKVYGLEVRSDHRHQLDLSHLEKGFYMARFTDGSELLETRRIQLR